MPIERIDDAGDPRLADYRDLTDVALRRVLEPAGGLYIAESAKVIRRAVAAGHRPRSILVQEKWLDDAASVAGDAPVYVVTDAVAERLTGYAVHRGALAAMHRPALPPVAEVVAGARTVLILEDVVDHTNVGAAFRAAAGLGADAVLVTPRCADPLYRRSVRVSMGTVFQAPVDAAAGMAGSRRRPARRRPPRGRSRARRRRRAARRVRRDAAGSGGAPHGRRGRRPVAPRARRGRHRRDDPDGRRCGLAQRRGRGSRRAVGAAGLTPGRAQAGCPGPAVRSRPGATTSTGRSDRVLAGSFVASEVA